MSEALDSIVLKITIEISYRGNRTKKRFKGATSRQMIMWVAKKETPRLVVVSKKKSKWMTKLLPLPYYYYLKEKNKKQKVKVLTFTFYLQMKW